MSRFRLSACPEPTRGSIAPTPQRACYGPPVSTGAPSEVPGSPEQPDDSVTEKLSQLRQHIQQLGSTLVCYSGGIDSALILAIAHEQLGDRAIAITAVSPSLPESERAGAQRTAKAIGARHYFVSSNELKRPGYVANGPDRCFHCKSELYELAAQKQQEWQLEHIVNGTNHDDLGDYRPGLQAADNANVDSPFVALGFNKQDVRDMAKAIGIKIWSKPASACLASRIPYGTSVTPERLSQVEQLESALKSLGVEQVRVRYHEKIARIEVPLQELPTLATEPVREQVVEAAKAAGFVYVTLDLAGYRTGSHNEVLSKRSLKVI